MKRLRKFEIFLMVLIVVIVTSIIVIQKRYIPESKAEENNSQKINVTYKSGIGEGEDVIVSQTLCDSQTQGTNDYTDGKIVLYRNGENGINFSAEQVEYNGVMYDRILNGWKLTSVIKDGTEITEFIEPENQNYADRTNANKDIGTVYAQKGWYIVPDGVTAITVEAVYARAIYVRSPFDKMYYDEVHIFYYGENNDGTTTLDGTAVAKSSDENDGSTEEKAVSTLKRAYSLMDENSNSTVYDTAFVLCGDMYEINYFSGYGKYATGTAGTYTNYSQQNFGYNSSYNKPVTIMNSNENSYSFFAISPGYDFNNYSSLRLDNLYFSVLPTNNVKKVHSELSATIGTFTRARQFNFYNTSSMFETTETLKTETSYMAIRYKNMKYMKLNGGYWNPVNTHGISSETLNKGKYIYIGGTAVISYVTTGGASNDSNIEGKLTNPIKIVITGGKITNGIYGTGYVQGGSVSGDVYIFASGGNVANIYGGGNGSVYANNNENGNVNIKITGGTFGNIYGGGQYYTSKIYGSININIENATVNGNVYGGGKGGKVLENTNLTIKNTKIKGNVFGGGLGITDQVQYTIVSYYSNQTFEQNKKTFNSRASAVGTVSWEEASNNFPSYNQETAEIEGRRYHRYSQANNSIYLYEYGVKYLLTLADVGKDIEVNIENSTIEKSVYGGASIGLVNGSVKLNLKNTNVTGNVYGGGDGKTTPSTIALYSPIQDYKELTSIGQDSNTKIGDFTWTNDKDILTYFKGIYDGKNKVIYNSDNTTTTFSELSEEAQAVVTKYGSKQLVYSSDAEKLGYVEGDIIVNIDGGTYKSAIYGGGNNGQVKGKVILEVNNVLSNQKIYTGGNTGNIEKSTKLTIKSGIYNNVFGGGYSGTVLGDSEIIIEKGTFTNIFGGGDQSYIQGNTNVTIGKENSDNNLVVTGLVYGGGRGYDANNDGDASDFTTVYGSSNVLIQGINTKVENYGSTKLGAVAGNVDVNFKDYWSGNSTAKYKTMNGIDRATTVSFDNSYVLLENKDSNGNLVGIQSIENLIIPKGSGLKISANGEITGNFEGGGELYLDSLVCLTVQGDITGQTTLVLNPKLMENGTQEIRGGINVPYLKVAGTALEDPIALISGESNKYIIFQADKQTVQEKVGENYIYYYIAEDIVIKNDIVVTSNSIEGRKYNENITNANETLITNNETFSADIKTTYYLTNDAYSTKDYTNISRKLKLISNSDEKKDVIIPVGTEITMIVNGEYYYYRVENDNIAQISLSDFVNSVSSNKKFNELTDITNSNLVDKTTNEINGTTSYSFKENYKFIFNFENSNGIEIDRYYPSLEIYYGKTSFENEKKDVANNIVDIQKRTYECNLENNREYYESDGKIEFLGNIKIGSLKENTYIKSKDLYLQIKIKDDNSNDIEIPQGTQITINDNKYSVKNGKCEAYFLDNLRTNGIDNKLNITLDMSEVLPQDRISKGNYKFILSYLNGKQYENILEKDITIIEKQDEYGVKAEINEDISNNQIQLIENNKDENRSIKVQYVNSSEFKDMKIKIMAVERTGEFEYKETNNSKNKISIGVSEIDLADQTNVEQDINITFNKNINSGTYRILVGLYDEFDHLKTFDYVNFIVE